MTQTTTDAQTLPPLSEAMSARDLQAHETALAKELGPNASVNIAISDYEGWVYISMNPHGVCNDTGREVIRGEAWPAAIQAAHNWVASRPKVERNAIIRKLALAIIEITDEHGKCTVEHLRAKTFISAEIALHAEACVRAGEMCQGAPFSVEGI
jgi:hypothetical protein